MVRCRYAAQSRDYSGLSQMKCNKQKVDITQYRKQQPMDTLNNTKNVEIVRQLSEAIEVMIDSIESGRIGFDYAIKVYVDQSDNELSSALQHFVTEILYT